MRDDAATQGPDAPDPDEVRARTRDHWERAAAGWSERNAFMQRIAMPVSRWMIDAIEPQPGQRVVELAAGVGETGFLAAELIQPGGTLVSSDGAEAMLERARVRAAELGLANVEFKPLDLEWIDLPTASADAILCRWGLMFALDPEASLREMRRVLRPGGRVALATWSAPERNPWATLPRAAAYDAGLVATVRADGPGPFELTDVDELRTLLADAGFADVVADEVEVRFAYADVDDYWDGVTSLSRSFVDLVAPLEERSRADLRERLAAAAERYRERDGRIVLPGVALVLAASA